MRKRHATLGGVTRRLVGQVVSEASPRLRHQGVGRLKIGLPISPRLEVSIVSRRRIDPMVIGLIPSSIGICLEVGLGGVSCSVWSFAHGSLCLLLECVLVPYAIRSGRQTSGYIYYHCVVDVANVWSGER